MTREEEILNKAFEYSKTYYDADIYRAFIARQAFAEGAKWADNNRRNNHEKTT